MLIDDLSKKSYCLECAVDTPEGDEAEIISIFIEKYEDEHYPIGAPDPIETIIFSMEQLDLSKSDLADY